MTQADAAKRLGLGGGSTLASYEQGDAEIPLSVLLELPKVYGADASPREILGGDGDAAHDLPEASRETSAPKEGDAMDARRFEELREMTARLFELNNQGNEVAQQHWTHLEHQVRTLLRDAEREG